MIRVIASRQIMTLIETCGTLQSSRMTDIHCLSFDSTVWAFLETLYHHRLVPELLQCLTEHSTAPVVILDNGIFIVPDSVEFFNQLGSNFSRQ